MTVRVFVALLYAADDAGRHHHCGDEYQDSSTCFQIAERATRQMMLMMHLGWAYSVGALSGPGLRKEGETIELYLSPSASSLTHCSVG